MLYSNPEYFVFLAVVWISYYIFGRTQSSRLWILTSASMFFYVWAGFFDGMVFAFVIAVSWISVLMADRARAERSRKFYLAGGIIVLSCHLLFWKYVPWISSSIQDFSPMFISGRKIQFDLPIGISFFTLQGIAYLIDFRRGEIGYVKFGNFLLFKSFFPQLIAGPIVRMHQIGPQLKNLPAARLFNVRDGLILFSIGFFKKVAIADRIAPTIDPFFSNPSGYTVGSAFIAILGYTIQIWADFSGYTDMGRGSAKMFGIQLPENFFAPYFSKGPSEFWRRWHVTLSQWIRDYIYIPLASFAVSNSDARGVTGRYVVVAIVTMLLSGLWHGAAYTFLIWGLYHGALLALEKVSNHLNIPVFRGKASILVTFILMMFGWLIFRSESFGNLVYTVRLLIGDASGGENRIGMLSVAWGTTCCLVFHSLTYVPIGRDISDDQKQPFYQRIQRAVVQPSQNILAILSALGISFVIYSALMMRVSGSSSTFIYFQF